MLHDTGTWGFMEIRVSESPPVCAGGEGNGLEQTHAYPMAGFHSGSCIIIILMNEIWVSL